MSGFTLTRPARTQAEIDAQDGLVTIAQAPIMGFVVATDWDGAPVLSMDAPDVCENVL